MVWSTATELNNYGFEIQRKSLNGNFSTIAFISDNGTSSNPHTYYFTDSNLDEGKYFYRLKRVDFDGTYQFSKIVEVDVRFLSSYSLEQNYPNPFNPSTTIGFVLQEAGKVRHAIMNNLGEEVAVLVNEEMDKGYHKVNFNSDNLSSGVYLYRLQVANFIDTKKMILLR